MESLIRTIDIIETPCNVNLPLHLHGIICNVIIPDCVPGFNMFDTVFVFFQLVLHVVQFEAHPVVDLVIIQPYVILIDRVPFLNPDLLCSRAQLSRSQFL
jgi:hypothetical protein